MRAEAAARGLGLADLIAQAGVPRGTMNRYWSGERMPPGDVLLKLADAVDSSTRFLLTGERDVPAAVGDRRLAWRGPEPEASTQDLVDVAVSDVAYGLGGAYLDDHAGETTVQRFPRAFIRQFAKGPLNQIYFATGIGDSMAPTIHNSDLVLIDRSQDQLRVNDQLWAVAAGSIGMIKRVRVLPGGEVLLVSDNADVSDYQVGEGELSLIGRVVAVVKRL